MFITRKPVCYGLFFIFFFSCAPRTFTAGSPISEPRMLLGRITVSDGTNFALRSWLPETKIPSAIILSLHGFNDYSNFFNKPGHFLAKRYNIASFSFDQRGFGNSKNLGYWAGTTTYVKDAKEIISLLGRHYPNIPIYLLGESMGGAIAMVAMSSPDPPKINGTILVSPAIWGRATMPVYQRAALWIGANIVPWMKVSGRGLKIKASDNVEMLRALGKDPLVIKETRIGTIFGLANLMDAALANAEGFLSHSLILYGEKDDVIPKEPMLVMLKRVLKKGGFRHRIGLYKNGYHMLLRDLEANVVMEDIASWILNRNKELPSGADRRNIFLRSK